MSHEFSKFYIANTMQLRWFRLTAGGKCINNQGYVVYKPLSSAIHTEIIKTSVGMAQVKYDIIATQKAFKLGGGWLAKSSKHTDSSRAHL